MYLLVNKMSSEFFKNCHQKFIDVRGILMELFQNLDQNSSVKVHTYI